MAANETPKLSPLRRFLRAIRSLWSEQDDLNERRKVIRTDAGTYGTNGRRRWRP